MRRRSLLAAGAYVATLAVLGGALWMKRASERATFSKRSARHALGQPPGADRQYGGASGPVRDGDRPAAPAQRDRRTSSLPMPPLTRSANRASRLAGTWVMEANDFRPCDAHRGCQEPAPARQRSYLYIAADGSGGYIERHEVIQKNPTHVWGATRSTWPPYYSFAIRAPISRLQFDGEALVLQRAPFQLREGSNHDYFIPYITAAFCEKTPETVTLRFDQGGLIDAQHRRYEMQAP